jgi:nucleotide-binding universal stress UspA family protein
MSFSKVLIAVENVPLALKVARTGFLLAESLKAQVALVHVVDKSLAVGDIDAGILPEQALAQLKREGEELIGQLIELYGKSLYPWHFLPEGKPDETILLMSKDWQADILVIGTRGRSGLQKLLMGSVAQAILRHSPCPVLVVRESYEYFNC